MIQHHFNMTKHVTTIRHFRFGHFMDKGTWVDDTYSLVWIVEVERIVWIPVWGSGDFNHTPSVTLGSAASTYPAVSSILGGREVLLCACCCLFSARSCLCRTGAGNLEVSAATAGAPRQKAGWRLWMTAGWMSVASPGFCASSCRVRCDSREAWWLAAPSWTSDCGKHLVFTEQLGGRAKLN